MGRYLRIAENVLRDSNTDADSRCRASIERPRSLTTPPPERIAISSDKMLREKSELCERSHQVEVHGVAEGEAIEQLLPHKAQAISDLEHIMAMREQGQIPPHYTVTTICKHCGPVPIFEGCGPEILGCPWCFNRLMGLPIPKPEKLR